MELVSSGFNYPGQLPVQTRYLWDIITGSHARMRKTQIIAIKISFKPTLSVEVSLTTLVTRRP